MTGRLTANGRCLKCSKEIAWYKGSSGYQLREPERDTDGNIIRDTFTVSGRTTTRPRPSAISHICGKDVEAKPKPENADKSKPKVYRIPAAANAAWERAEKAVDCRMAERILLYGPPGTAKTEFTFRKAQANGWGYVYQILTEETPASDLAGHFIIKGGDTVWCDGSLLRAARESHERPVIYCLDEIGRASADAMSYTLLALQNPESMRIVTRTGEIVQPKPGNWQVICTTNGEPTELPDPVRDRLHVAIEITHPHPDLVASLQFPESQRAVTSSSREFSTRAILTYDRLRVAGWSIEDAAKLVWDPASAKSWIDANKLNEET